MSSRRQHRPYPPPKLDMAAMIDVVFLLLIFFVMILKPVDIYAKLDVSTQGKPTPRPDIPTTYNVIITTDGFLADGTCVTYEKMDEDLAGLTKWTDDLVVTIRAEEESEHGRLIQILDLCHKYDIEQTQLVR